MAKREVIQIPGLGHGANPIPLAVKIGGMLFTGSLSGTEPETGATPTDPAKQIELAFQNIRRVLEKAGGTTDDIAKVDVRLKDMAHRALVNEEWVKMFPDEQNRPVRHTVKFDLPGETAIQVEIVAVIG